MGNNLGKKIDALDAKIYAQKAEGLFTEGYNCAQAVVFAFNDVLNLDTNMILSLSSSFGGGMGRLREVCGAVTGASKPTPEKRTKEYYEKRPCPKKVYSSAYILADYINEIENM